MENIKANIKNIIDNNIYQNCKALIKEEADKEHKHNPNDKPRVRECLNNLLDDLIRQIDFHVMRETITESKGKQYKERLTNYVIKRHEK